MRKPHAPAELPPPRDEATMYLAAILDKLNELGDQLATHGSQPGYIELQEPAKPARARAPRAEK